MKIYFCLILMCTLGDFQITYNSQQDYNNDPNYGYQQYPGYEQNSGYQQYSDYQQNSGYQQYSDYQQNSGYQQYPVSQQNSGYQQYPGYQQNSGYQQYPDYQQNSGYQQYPQYQQNSGYQQSFEYASRGPPCMCALPVMQNVDAITSLQAYRDSLESLCGHYGPGICHVDCNGGCSDQSLIYNTNRCESTLACDNYRKARDGQYN